MAKTPIKSERDIAKELELKRLQKQVERIKRWSMGMVAYLGLVFGTLANQLFPNISVKDGIIDATMEPLRWVHIVGALVVSVLLFSVLERKGDVLGKNKNMGRIVRTAFFMGFFWNEIIGRVLG